MIRQRGPFRFVGSIGDLSFYKDKRHGSIARYKDGSTREQIKKRKSMVVTECYCHHIANT